jgi:hypothetical protein
MEDTSPEMFDAYIARLRSMTTVEKFRALDGLMTEGRELARLGIRLRHPEAGPEEVKVRLFVRLYGRELAERVYPTVPSDAM